MRIIKYVFLLILLAAIATAVYVATQKGDFNVTKSVVIDVSRPVVFNYVNDYKNWEDWGSWKEDDPGMSFSYPANTVGNGAFYTWTGRSGSGKTTTLSIKQNDSISQKVIISGNESNSVFRFQDIGGKTKITWISKGKVDFMSKIYATFTGGVNKMMENMEERSLNNLSRVISREMNTFDVKVNGISQKNGTFYLKQTTKCPTSEVQSKILLMLPRMVNFFKKNKIAMNGNPFVRYDNIANDSITFSVCGPLAEEVYITDGDVSVSWLDTSSVLKTTLTGDYSHRSEARKKAVQYLSDNHIEENPALPKIDVYVKSASDIRYPSKWVTELLVPVKTVAPRAVVPAAAVVAPVHTSTPEPANPTP